MQLFSGFLQYVQDFNAGSSETDTCIENIINVYSNVSFSGR